ncbi:MAG: DUF1611 domain-containing protein [Cyclobacteriaceae bacterium]
MDGTAVIYTHGMLHQSNAKTAHGLIRSGSRYQITSVIDHNHVGKDAGELVDGKARNIPIYASVSDMVEQGGAPPDYLIIGIATKGGYLPKEMKLVIKQAMANAISIVNGLHEFMHDDLELLELSQQHNVSLVDIRKPRAKTELNFWTGAIHSVACPIVAVMGTDCALGKRTTARFLTEAAKEAELNAQMIYTGQTGWLQGGEYGFIFDSTYNDFVSGELEHAIVTCSKETNPDMVIIEGQAALQNPSGPCGSEFLVSAAVDGVVLMHSPTRTHYGDIESFGEIKPLQTDLDLIRLYGSKTIAIALHTEGLSLDKAKEYQSQYQDQYELPVILPVEDGVSSIIPVIQQLPKTSAL